MKCSFAVAICAILLFTVICTGPSTIEVDIQYDTPLILWLAIIGPAFCGKTHIFTEFCAMILSVKYYVHVYIYYILLVKIMLFLIYLSGMIIGEKYLNWLITGIDKNISQIQQVHFQN